MASQYGWIKLMHACPKCNREYENQYLAESCECGIDPKTGQPVKVAKRPGKKGRQAANLFDRPSGEGGQS